LPGIPRKVRQIKAVKPKAGNSQGGIFKPQLAGFGLEISIARNSTEFPANVGEQFASSSWQDFTKPGVHLDPRCPEFHGIPGIFRASHPKRTPVKFEMPGYFSGSPI
jgi:hypothetical protein